MSVSRLSKLRAMTPGEISHRLAYRAYTAFERAAHAQGSLAPPDRLRRALRTDLSARHDWQHRLLQRQSAPRFFAWEDDPAAMLTAFQHQFAPQLSKARALAEEVARHEIAFFGETFRLGPEINWHADPATGAEWPRTYHRDVPVNGGNIGFGDVKYVWELNRHQFFVDLAKIAFLDRSKKHADSLHSMLRSWNAAVPYGTGVPWACALEPAFRAYSWLWAYNLVRAAGLLDEETHLLWLTGLYDHGRFLYRHLEHYSSPYNHLIGEAATLFALGLLLPEVRESAEWVRRGRTVMESTVGDQFYADGGSVEQSTFYHHATLGFYLLSMILGRRSAVEFSGNVHSAIERGLEFSIALMQPDRRLPRIGGADDGKPIRLEHLPFWDFRPYYAIGAVFFSRPDFKFAAGRYWEDALWLLGPEGLARFDALETLEPPRAKALPTSGYYVARSDWSDTGDFLCFDCGEQAAGLRKDEVPSAAHGHADCLSVVLSLGGEEVLVDPGFFCYNGDPQWEVYFRKTPAHNTLAIDSRDQSRHLSKMAWSHAYEAQPEGWSDAGALAWARGSHNGYARGTNGVVHRRTVWLRDEGYLIILDEVLGSGRHTVQASFQFAPGTLEDEGPAAVLFNGRFELAWSCTTDSKATIVTGANGPDGGWLAHSLGVREAAPRLVVDFATGGARTALLTVVADRTRVVGGARRISAGRSRPELSLCVRAAAGCEDLVIAGDGQQLGGIETDAAVMAVRACRGRVIETRCIGGSYLGASDVVVAGTHVEV